MAGVLPSGDSVAGLCESNYRPIDYKQRLALVRLNYAGLTPLYEIDKALHNGELEPFEASHPAAHYTLRVTRKGMVFVSQEPLATRPVISADGNRRWSF